MSPYSKSSLAINNFNTSKGGVEFIFDPSTSTILVRGQKSIAQHEYLAASINAPRNQVVGGILNKQTNGVIYTNENTGHFWQNWTPEIRSKFTQTMEVYGLKVIHKEGMF
jgi:hypothetical protein